MYSRQITIERHILEPERADYPEPMGVFSKLL